MAELAARGWKTFKTSAKEGAGVEEAFVELGRADDAAGLTTMADSGSPADRCPRSARLRAFRARRRRATCVCRAPRRPGCERLWPSLTSAGDTLPLARLRRSSKIFSSMPRNAGPAAAPRARNPARGSSRRADGAEVSLEATALTVDGRAAFCCSSGSAKFSKRRSRCCKRRARPSSPISVSIPKRRKRRSCSAASPRK